MFIRKQLGRLFLLGGVGLAGYQVWLWYLNGTWPPYPMAFLVQEMINSLGNLLESMPGASSESTSAWASFRSSEFPFYVRRFLEVIPASGFLLLSGNFLFKWEKYMGLGLRT
jgi:hypothetical protein